MPTQTPSPTSPSSNSNYTISSTSSDPCFSDLTPIPCMNTKLSSPMSLNENKNGLSYFSDAVQAQISETDLDALISTKISKVLIIYTGGTIGMHHTKEHGYVPLPNYLYQLLSTNYRFHQPSKGYDAFLYNEVLTAENSEPTLLPALITPPSLFEKRIQYSILEYDPLLDSSNMSMKDWVRLAKDIELNYLLFDAFIILHGTDTMAFTSSILSFMLENLNKTVILTGSQIPIMEVRNDAVENLLGALQIAGHFVIPEVTLFFNQKLLRGNRASKLDAIHFDAFDSPNFPPLVTMGIHMHVHWDRVWSPSPSMPLKVHTQLNTKVASLRLFPGMTSDILKAFFHPSIQGVVVETYGAGNAPDRDPEFLTTFREASKRGVVLVNCTQCIRGHVSDTYKTGKLLNEAGLIPGADMTPECALTKLTYLLGLAQAHSFSSDWVREQMQLSLRGELTYKNNSTLLHLSKAAALGNIPTLMAMETSHQGEVNWTLPDFSGASPLHHAVNHGHVEAVKVMLRSFKGPKTDLSRLDNYGCSPLGSAFIHHHMAMVSLLISQGAVLHVSEWPKLWNSLIHVIETGQLTWLHLYFQGGIDLCIQGPEKKSLLHLAVAYLQLEIVQYLIRQPKIDLSATDVYGLTPLKQLLILEQSLLEKNDHDKRLKKIHQIRSLLMSIENKSTN